MAKETECVCYLKITQWELGKCSVLRCVWISYFEFLLCLEGAVGQADILHFSFDLNTKLVSTAVPRIGAPGMWLSD